MTFYEAPPYDTGHRLHHARTPHEARRRARHERMTSG